MYGTYRRLNVHVGASNIEVIRAARRSLMSHSLDHQHRAGRHRFFRQMLAYHDLKITEIEYRCAINLSRLSDISKEDLAAYWQLCRCYRGQIYIREEAERALKILRCEA